MGVKGSEGERSERKERECKCTDLSELDLYVLSFQTFRSAPFFPKGSSLFFKDS
jgi:hypothetical protein